MLSFIRGALLVVLTMWPQRKKKTKGEPKKIRKSCHSIVYCGSGTLCRGVKGDSWLKEDLLSDLTNVAANAATQTTHKRTHAKSITTQTERKASAIRLWCQIETKLLLLQVVKQWFGATNKLSFRIYFLKNQTISHCYQKIYIFEKLDMWNFLKQRKKFKNSISF